MKMCICAVLDSAVGAYGAPLQFRTTAEAARDFVSACKDGKQSFVQFPEHYSLVHLAYYDSSTGEFKNKNPETVITALQAIHHGSAAIDEKHQGGSLCVV